MKVLSILTIWTIFFNIFILASIIYFSQYFRPQEYFCFGSTDEMNQCFSLLYILLFCFRFPQDQYKYPLVQKFKSGYCQLCVSKGPYFSFCFFSRPQGQYLPVFVRLLSVHLLLLYSYNRSNVYFPFRKPPLLLLWSRPAPRTGIWTVASIVSAVFFQGGS